MVDDISHEGLRGLLREEEVSSHGMKTWTTSRDPDYAATKARVERLYAFADGEALEVRRYLRTSGRRQSAWRSWVTTTSRT
ncbi:hypothetical protein HD597_012575 [Nonomuraea thailandensis]|uniref:Transposase n=1 Tax=Nonomuraea thailandensis TaxID=1188745 RepID=A0A9X2GX36_9ACTN|nr:hypothetical protein [Nonomuraea thailandensis]MCP2365555.1 hypothetical protein [Nonomuraea thailandensis]